MRSRRELMPGRGDRPIGQETFTIRSVSNPLALQIHGGLRQGAESVEGCPSVDGNEGAERVAAGGGRLGGKGCDGVAVHLSAEGCQKTQEGRSLAGSALAWCLLEGLRR
jgi:hypothetical protein